MKLKQIVDPNETEVEFTDETVQSKFTLA